ncbi:MAG: hypothetical protein JW760_07835 [Spirochaetales bacterium]|nr:hypothetical protein [Spirochaetales bacterium]
MLTLESSPAVIILVNVLAWTVVNLLSGYIASILPASLFRPCSWWYKPRAFEQGGRLYRRILAVRLWKRLLPDGGNFFGNGFQKKRLAQPRDSGYYRVFAVETCRAEFTHNVGILSSLLFFAWNHWSIALWMIPYALAVNLPCIIAQRYNRPRLLRMAEALERREWPENEARQ